MCRSRKLKGRLSGGNVSYCKLGLRLMGRMRGGGAIRWLSSLYVSPFVIVYYYMFSFLLIINLFIINNKLQYYSINVS